MEKIAYVWGDKKIALSVCRVHGEEAQGIETSYNSLPHMERYIEQMPEKLRKEGYKVIFSKPPEGLKPAKPRCICD